MYADSYSHDDSEVKAVRMAKRSDLRLQFTTFVSSTYLPLLNTNQVNARVTLHTDLEMEPVG